MPDPYEAPAAHPFDSARFRQVLGHFPTGVTVITGIVDDQPVGFTIGSFMSVSLDPPLVGFLPMVTSERWQGPGGRWRRRRPGPAPRR